MHLLKESMKTDKPHRTLTIIIIISIILARTLLSLQSHLITEGIEMLFTYLDYTN